MKPPVDLIVSLSLAVLSSSIPAQRELLYDHLDQTIKTWFDCSIPGEIEIRMSHPTPQDRQLWLKLIIESDQTYQLSVFDSVQNNQGTSNE